MSDLDERTLKILKAVAIEKTYEDDMGVYCIFCSGDRDYENQFDDIAHMPACETIEARAILHEQGIPLYGYRVTFESPESLTFRKWRTSTFYVEGFSEQEVRACYPENTKPHVYPKRRNIQIEQGREL